MIIGIVGLSGAGKDAAMEYLRSKYGYVKLSMADPIVEVAKRKSIYPSRLNLMKISVEYINTYGKGYFVEQIVTKILDNKWTDVGISGIRSCNDVKTFKRYFGDSFKLIYVRVKDPAIRFRRILLRNDGRGPDTFEEFLEKDSVEEIEFKISETVKKADVVIDNEGDVDDLHLAVDTLVHNNWRQS
jgi:dephospho-CoA kinase